MQTLAILLRGDALRYIAHDDAQCLALPCIGGAAVRPGQLTGFVGIRVKAHVGMKAGTIAPQHRQLSGGAPAGTTCALKNFPATVGRVDQRCDRCMGQPFTVHRKQLAGRRVRCPDRTVGAYPENGIGTVLEQQPVPALAGRQCPDESPLPGERRTEHRRQSQHQQAAQGRGAIEQALARTHGGIDVGHRRGHQHHQRMFRQDLVAGRSQLAVGGGYTDVVAGPCLRNFLEELRGPDVFTEADLAAVAPHPRDAVQADQRHCGARPHVGIQIVGGKERRVEGHERHAGKTSVGLAETASERNQPLAGETSLDRFADDQPVTRVARVRLEVLAVGKVDGHPVGGRGDHFATCIDEGHHAHVAAIDPHGGQPAIQVANGSLRHKVVAHAEQDQVEDLERTRHALFV